MKSIKTPETIIISRTDNIGDVVLTLPVAGVLKERFPGCRIIFLGKEYTRAVVNTCKYVDEFIEKDEFLHSQFTEKKPGTIIHVFPSKPVAVKARAQKIPFRIGTTNRIYHWFTCNKLVRLSRKNSDLHEAQLNLKLLQPLGITGSFSPEEIIRHLNMEKLEKLRPEFAAMIQPGKYHVILHPATQGSAREWGLDNFISLIHLLDPARFNIFISGTTKDKKFLKPLLDQVGDRVTDISGTMELSQFISFIESCDGLVANSTGPLHIAAAMGKDAMGIFPPLRPVHPGRWAPLGKKAKVFVLERECNDCRKDPRACHCIAEIKPSWINEELERRAGLISS